MKTAETTEQRAEHWNDIFSHKADQELGWYEQDVGQTLKYLDLAELPATARIFLPGVGRSGIVSALLQRQYQLILNDVSTCALEELKQRCTAPDRCRWLLHDISVPLQAEVSADIWIDRAVLHFLLGEKEISQYFDNLRRVISKGGYALFAEFASDGASSCAGLAVHRYSLEELSRRMGERFELVAHEHYQFTTPAGGTRPYIYALYRHL
ncbi:class I SAM-dependent methyltransferase [Porticoccaceae bacterium LTM1]|nr:class I SAM-dependent methyltransferase [Porticoccaceae bacterium LTM1]